MLGWTARADADLIRYVTHKIRAGILLASATRRAVHDSTSTRSCRKLLADEHPRLLVDCCEAISVARSRGCAFSDQCLGTASRCAKSDDVMCVTASQDSQELVHSFKHLAVCAVREDISDAHALRQRVQVTVTGCDHQLEKNLTLINSP